MSKFVICTDVHGKEYKVPVKDLKWRPSAYGIVIQNNSILLSKQFDGYDLPGGGIDLGETPEDGVIREVKEETGLDVRGPKLLGIENSFFQSAHAENESYQSLMFFYLCTHVGGELSTEGFDEYEKQYAGLAEWFPLDKLNEIKVAGSVDYRRFIKKALKV